MAATGIVGTSRLSIYGGISDGIGSRRAARRCRCGRWGLICLGLRVRGWRELRCLDKVNYEVMLGSGKEVDLGRLEGALHRR